MAELSIGGTRSAGPLLQRGLRAPWLPGLLAALGVLVMILFTAHAAVLRGALADPDSYMQIVRFRDLIANGWGNGGALMRDNAPYGLVLHWTRAYDLLVFALAAPLAAVVGWSAAITSIGPALAPLWIGILVVVSVWAAAPACRTDERAAIGIVIALSPITLMWGGFGNADHHLAVLVAWTVQLGFMLRVASGRPGWRHGAGAGIAAAVALWISTDCIAAVSLGLTVMGALWIRDGAPYLRANLAAAISLAAALTLVLAVDPPHGGWRTDVIDRLSIVFVTFSWLLAAMWLGLAFAPQRREAWRPRLAIAATGAVLSAAVLALAFPQLLDPQASMLVPIDGEMFWDAIDENQPAFRQLHYGVMYMGEPIVGFVAALAFAWLARGSRALPAWLAFLALLAATGAISLLHTRFAIYPELLAALPIGIMLARLRPFMARRLPRAKGEFWGTALGMTIVILPLIAAAALTPKAAGARAAQPRCGIPAVAGALNDPKFMGGRDRIILSHPNFTPTLLYWTGNRTLAGPYHRNVRGLTDVSRFLTSRDDRAAREIAARRGIDYVLICHGYYASWPRRAGGETLNERLDAGRVPAWLAAQPWPTKIATDLALFRVVSP